MAANASKQAIEEIEAFARRLKHCGNVKDIVEGKRVHGCIADSGYTRKRYLSNLLVQMYGKCGSLEDARRVFDETTPKNLFSWSLMAAAYAQNGHLEGAKWVFDRTPELDVVSWTSMVVAYAQCGKIENARRMFETMPNRDVFSWNNMLAAYARDGHVEEAREMFDEMPERDVISWNSIVTSYVQNGYLEEARQAFDKMPKQDAVSWTAMVQAYAQNGHLEKAQCMFAKMPDGNVVSWTAMIQGYAQNGHLEEAQKMFDEMPERNTVSWSAMVTAYAQNGHGRGAIDVFHRMHTEGVRPDEISFMSVLIGCSYIGLVDAGRDYFNSMAFDFGLRPLREHYCCMIDMLGRAGRLRDAEQLIISMPFSPNEISWRSLLSACKMYRDVQRGARAAEELLKFDQGSATPYVLLRDLYAAAGMNAEVVMVRKMMKDRGVHKQPGISEVRIQGKTHRFVAGDGLSHPQHELIRAEWERLTRLMHEAGYVPDTKEVLHEVTEDEKRRLLSCHSEKLAVVFGLISTSSGTTLSVVKNLRVCLDCHTAIKFISGIVKRRLIVRDPNRFHHFENGKCSCGDYW